MAVVVFFNVFVFVGLETFGVFALVTVLVFATVLDLTILEGNFLIGVADFLIGVADFLIVLVIAEVFLVGFAGELTTGVGLGFFLRDVGEATTAGPFDSPSFLTTISAFNLRNSRTGKCTLWCFPIASTKRKTCKFKRNWRFVAFNALERRLPNCGLFRLEKSVGEVFFIKKNETKDLFENFYNTPGANCVPSFTNGKFSVFFNRNWRNQINGQFDIITRHRHFNSRL